MLVVSRKVGELMFVYEMKTRALIGKIIVVETGGTGRSKLGFLFSKEFGVIRPNKTQFSRLSSSELLAIELGTILDM